jgi:hypothetical protein
MTEGLRIPGLVIARPRILEARRHDLATFSVGDEAVIEFGPGLLQFLSLRDDQGTTLGEGGAFEWTIPVGAAGTAAYAAVEPPGFEGVNTWTGVTNVVRWKRPSRTDETLIATCRIAALTRAATLPYRVYSRERGDLIVDGEFVFVSVQSDGQSLCVIEPRRRPGASPIARERRHPRNSSLRSPAPLVAEDDAAASQPWAHLPMWSANAPRLQQPAEAVADPLFAMRPPRVIRASAPRGTPGAIWEWLFPRDLLRLLGHPIGGGEEPLGRRHHPYGRLLEGMGIHAALAISGGNMPLTLSVEWWSPTRGEAHFRVRSTLVSCAAGSAKSAHDVYEGERPVGTVSVTTHTE